MMHRGMIRQLKSGLRSICPRAVLLWREARYFEKNGEFELGFVKDLCRPAQDAIDVGANEGCYIHFMRRHARQVYAFEPVPWLADGLRRKFRTGVTVKNVALSNARGTARLRIPVIDGQLMTGLSSLDTPAGPGIAFRDVEVQTAPLDDVYRGNLGFLKIDVEGHEEAVLAGARRTIARCRPRLQVEVIEEMAPGGLCRVAGVLADYGYHGFFVHDHALKPISDFDPVTMQRSELVAGYGPGIACKVFGKYVANFLFFPSDEPAQTFRNIRNTIARATAEGVRAEAPPVAAVRPSHPAPAA
jgi:FkbM family methyltransferase